MHLLLVAASRVPPAIALPRVDGPIRSSFVSLRPPAPSAPDPIFASGGQAVITHKCDSEVEKGTPEAPVGAKNLIRI
jgi:hypothetical protein